MGIMVKVIKLLLIFIRLFIVFLEKFVKIEFFFFKILLYSVLVLGICVKLNFLYIFFKKFFILLNILFIFDIFVNNVGIIEII